MTGFWVLVSLAVAIVYLLVLLNKLSRMFWGAVGSDAGQSIIVEVFKSMLP